MLIVGWQERVDLSLLGLHQLKAKIDTGARTSALHATEIFTFERAGVPWVRFHTSFNDDSQDTDVECPIHDVREIKNTSGVPEMRIVVRTKLRIANRLWKINLSLADRSGMEFRMIIGRSALRRHAILVNPSLRNLTTPVDPHDIGKQRYHNEDSNARPKP